MEGILAQIEKGEGQKTEFKASFQKEVLESIVAFANAKGGKIFIGISDSAKIITGEPQRIERYDYPLEAIREIVTNMIVHRDYRDSGDSIVKIFDDHITFFNPGKLYDGLTVEKLQSGNYSSRSRNKALAKMFKEVGSIEKYGSGIARIKQECHNHGIAEPEIEEFQHGFRVTLYKQKQDGGVNGGVNAICEMITNTPNLKAKQIAEASNIPLRTVERELKKLKDQGKICFKGAAKTGGYYAK